MTSVTGERRRSFGTTARVSISALNPMDKLPAGVNPDEYVPPYYIERKRQRDSIEDRKEQEGGLMTELSAGVLAGGVSASTEPRDQKKPTAYATQEGVQTAQHPPEFIKQHPPQRVKNPKKD